MTPFLRSLVERGLDVSQGLLVIVDGGKGLRAAVRKAFRHRALVQRCQWHTRENVVSYVAKREQPVWRQRLQRAYNRPEYDEALAALQSLQHELEDRNQSAAGSLAEGLDETLTLHRLGVYGVLGRSLKTTNGLESINALIEERCAKVDHWQNSSQRQRWLATALLDHRVAGLAGGLGNVADELRKRTESMTARERRFDAREKGYVSQIEDVRASFAVVNQVAHTMKREFERLQTMTRPTTAPDGGAEPVEAAAVSSLDSHKYVGFEDLYRGSTDDISRRLTGYLDDFSGASDVLDIGCGRGEFLELLRERGIDARGLDSNHEMVEVCRQRGLVCDESDALTFLEGLDDAALGGLFAAQVVEHLEASYLLKLLDTAYLKLKPGSRMILETINVASWSAFFHSYIRDITHERPLHPETLEYLVSASGFQNVQIRYLSPYPDDFKLKPVPLPSQPSDGTAESSVAFGVAVTFNENVEKMNHLLFADQDYAIIAERR